MPTPQDDISTRQIAFALVRAPYKPPTRKDGIAFVQGLSERGIPDLSYRYNQNLQSDGSEAPSITLLGRDGRSQTEVKVDQFNGQLRILLNYLFPRSRSVALREIDEIFALFDETLGNGLDNQLVELKLGVDAPTRRGTARAQLANRFFGNDELKILGLVDFASITLNTAPEERELVSELDSPTRSIRVERLLEDPKRLFIELTSRWPKVSQVMKDPNEAGSVEVRVGPGPLSLGLKRPSEYVDDSEAFIKDSVIPFVHAASGSS